MDRTIINMPNCIRSIVSASPNNIVDNVVDMHGNLHTAISNAKVLMSYHGSRDSRMEALHAVCNASDIHIPSLLKACETIADIYYNNDYSRSTYANSVLKAARSVQKGENIRDNAKTVHSAARWCSRAVNDKHVKQLERSTKHISSRELGIPHNRFIDVVVTAMTNVSESISLLRISIDAVNASVSASFSAREYPEHIQVVMDMLLDNGHNSIVDHILGLPSGTSNDFRPLGNMYTKANAGIKKLIEEFINYIPLRGIDLSGCDLRGISIYGADLSATILTGCDFTGANISHCNMRGININNAIFTNCTLSKNDITSHMQNVMFNNTRIDDTSFVNCTMTNVDFSNAIIDNTKFISSSIRHSTFDRLRVGALKLSATQTIELTFIDADLRDTTLVNSIMEKCDFSGADLHNVRISNTDFIECVVNQHTNNADIITMGQY